MLKNKHASYYSLQPFGPSLLLQKVADMIR